MKVLLLGSGGREHALALKISQSPLCDHLFIAPGNAGTSECGTNVPLSLVNFPEVGAFVIKNGINMVVVGPEEPLVNGIHDYFLEQKELQGIPVIGPSKAGAALEGSKDVAKSFMMRHHIPTAAYRTFTKDQLAEAKNFLKELSPPYVLKADGLAAGKGVVIPDQPDAAEKELDAMLGQAKFGTAGDKVVIEKFLKGIELSVFVLTDGNSYMILPEAKDYKRVGDHDTGPNTGGMGAVSPVPFAGKEFMQKVEERIVRPSIEGLKKDGIPYVGFLFIGLMNVKGDPFVIEYNVRMGDPETEVVMPRIQNDILELFTAAASGRLSDHRLRVDPRTAITVVAVSGGYPGSYEKGKVISGLSLVKGSTVYHAGTARMDDAIVSNGGRVLALTTLATSIEEARAISYGNLEKISFEGMACRRDIGLDLLPARAEAAGQR